MTGIKKRLQDRKQSGQGMAEYIIIVVLVALICIAAVTVFGQRIFGLFNAASEELGGDTASQDKAEIGDW